MTGTLSLRILTTRSSYRENRSESAIGHPESDTVQTWVGPKDTFMIHTYGLDHDIRIFRVDTVPSGFEFIERSNVESYGDIVDRHMVIEFVNVLDDEEVKFKFSEFSLDPTIEVEEGAFMFWCSGDARYSTVSDPI